MNRLGSGDNNDNSNTPPVTSESESLLKKYDIPIEHLDFKYVEECNNAKELEQILHILQSGQEGYYPELTQCAEEKLLQLNPFSKRLRKQEKVLTKYDVNREEWTNLNSDVEDWIKNMNKNDRELLSFKNINNDPSNEIPIREFKNSKMSKNELEKPHRIKSMDYEKWDKLDVDAEMLKMDLSEEKLKRENQKIVEIKEKLNTVVVKPDYMTEAEKKHSALEEKTRGNEFFKSGDYEEALNYYTNSLNLMPSVEAYNNRAITYIKLNQNENAINDCNEVLKIDPLNQKGLLRKALALKNLKNYEKASICLHQVIEKDPNNKLAQSMMKNLSEKIPKSKPTRLNIQEIKSEPSKLPLKNHTVSKNSQISLKSPSKNLLVPIPGTSCDKPPFYKIVNVPNDVEEKYKKSCKKTHHPSDEKVINLNEINSKNIYKKKISQIIGKNQATNENELKSECQKIDRIQNGSSEKQNSEKIERNENGNVNSTLYFSEKESNVEKSESRNGTKEIQNEDSYVTENFEKKSSMHDFSGEKMKVQTIESQNKTNNAQNQKGDCLNKNWAQKGDLLTQNKRLLTMSNGTDSQNRKNMAPNGDSSAQNDTGNQNGSFLTQNGVCSRSQNGDSLTKKDNVLIQNKSGFDFTKSRHDFDENSTEFNEKMFDFDPKEISPYGFTKYWQSIKNDTSLRKLEKILRTVDASELCTAIGNKLDGEMLAFVLDCLKKHFLKTEDSALTINLLEKFVKLPRFSIISMLMSPQEKKVAKNILDFLTSYGHNVGHLKSLIN